MKKEHLFSTIFEKEEDCENTPFIFDKTNLKPRQTEYEGVKF